MPKLFPADSASPIWLLGDHLGSTSVAANTNGSLLSRQGYLPWGELRFAEGSLPGRYQFTGQASYEAEFGLYYFKARWYDPHLGRFSQPDTNVPDRYHPEGLDRYAYVVNNPILYTDSSGHCWGIASGIRGVPGYALTCDHLDMALSIVQHPAASLKDKVLAGGYIVIEAGAHTALAIGTAGLACAVAGPSCVVAVEGALGIGTGFSLDGDPTNDALAAARTAESVFDKLMRYLLNPDHPRGSTMVTWYERALGFTQENIGDLAKQIVFDRKTAYVTEVTRFGTKYNQIISITGANGKVIDIVAAWIEHADGTIKLITTVPWK